MSVAGCGVIRDATSPINRDRIIDDMSRQLERGREVTYLADYQLAGGERATVAQQAAQKRTFYGFPGGIILLDEKGLTQCDRTLHPAKCEVRALAPAAASLAPGYAEATKHGLITSPVLADLLRITTLQVKAEVEPQDATIAGLPASCVKVSGLLEAPATGFTACVTADGVLATFTGDVNGLHIDQALVRVGRKPADEVFVLPEGAQIHDLRQP
jgi:hypothetical protein